MPSLVRACVVVAVLSPAAAALSQTADQPEGPPPAASASSPAAAGSASTKSGSLFSGLTQELMGLPSKGTAITLGVGGMLAFAAHPADSTLTQRASLSMPLEEILDPGDWAGSGWVQGGAALATWLVGQASGKLPVQEVGADLVQAQLVAAMMTQGLKFTVGRARPDQGKYSFPSGHASATFANAAALQRHFGWKVGLPAYGAATYVGGIL